MNTSIGQRARTLTWALTWMLAGGTSAHAGVVTVWGEALSGFRPSIINDFYNGLPGHSSTIAGGTLDRVDLSGVNLLWATQPADAYTAAELDAMGSFLAGGGRIAFLGEHGLFAPAQNTRINAALLALGSTLSIDNVMQDSGFRTASVGDGQILAHPLTVGVNSYEYAAFAPLSLGGAAEALMLGENRYLGAPSVMMAYQPIGLGSIFLITDQNVWDHSPTWSGRFDNARMFENLLSGNVAARTLYAVPEPTALALLGIGLVALGALRCRPPA